MAQGRLKLSPRKFLSEAACVAGIAFWRSKRNDRQAHRKCSSYVERGGGEKKSGLAQRVSKLSCRERGANPHGTSFQRHLRAKPGAERVSAERDSLDRAEVGRPAWECSSHTSYVLFDPRTSMEDRLVVGCVMSLVGSRTTDTRRRSAGHHDSVETENEICRNENGLPIASIGCTPSRPPRSYGGACGRPAKAMDSACSGQSSIRRYHFRTIAGTAHGANARVVGTRPGD